MRNYIFADGGREQAEAEGEDLQVTCNSGFQGGFMRTYIFTERERRLLKAWLEGGWRTTCPHGCRSNEGNPVSLRPRLHIPYDEDLFHELNVERFELAKKGKILFNQPEGTHDDRLWALAVLEAKVPSPPGRPIARFI